MIIPQNKSYKANLTDKNLVIIIKFFAGFLTYEICHFPNSFIINLLAKISKIKSLLDSRLSLILL